MVKWYQRLVEDHPDIVSLTPSIGQSYYERHIFALHFTSRDVVRHKPKIYLQCLLHASKLSIDENDTHIHTCTHTDIGLYTLMHVHKYRHTVHVFMSIIIIHALHVTMHNMLIVCYKTDSCLHHLHTQHFCYLLFV